MSVKCRVLRLAWASAEKEPSLDPSSPSPSTSCPRRIDYTNDNIFAITRFGRYH